MKEFIEQDAKRNIIKAYEEHVDIFGSAVPELVWLVIELRTFYDQYSEEGRRELDNKIDALLYTISLMGKIEEQYKKILKCA